MPINIPKDLPAYKKLKEENIFVMNNKRASNQDIRPLKIGILNLMPKKIEAENQILRYLSNTPLQVEIKLIQTRTYNSKNTSREHLDKFYKFFDDIKNEKFDGFIITGAPVEKLDFEEVIYFEELKEIMAWCKTNVYSTMHICWGAQAGLYYHHGVKKEILDKKMFGIFKHKVKDLKEELTRGLDDYFYAPHSRHSKVNEEDIKNNKNLKVLSYSDEAGVFILSNLDGREIYITGHLEYDKDTLKNEYIRDREKGMNIDVPKNYFLDDDPRNSPIVTWRGSANIVFYNWLNYCVYQNTPFDINKIK
ncbi:MAG: homoserine O-acetyltransferase MetA [Clostridium chrysemydis]|uniref:homoserine O-acetyltransferase MetA n=1 Tax=Clostridium chrysemydis TaxID=2665504 RepID=UPI003F2E1DEE